MAEAAAARAQVDQAEPAIRACGRSSAVPKTDPPLTMRRTTNDHNTQKMGLVMGAGCAGMLIGEISRGGGSHCAPPPRNYELNGLSAEIVVASAGTVEVPVADFFVTGSGVFGSRPQFIFRDNPALTIIVSHHRKGGWCNRETWYSLSYSCMFVYAFACMLYPHLCMYAWRGAKGPLPGGSFGGLWAGTSWRVRPLQDLAAAVLQASEDVLDTSLGGIEPLCAIGRAFVGLDL